MTAVGAAIAGLAAVLTYLGTISDFACERLSLGCSIGTGVQLVQFSMDPDAMFRHTGSHENFVAGHIVPGDTIRTWEPTDEWYLMRDTIARFDPHPVIEVGSARATQIDRWRPTFYATFLNRSRTTVVATGVRMHVETSIDEGDGGAYVPDVLASTDLHLPPDGGVVTGDFTPPVVIPPGASARVRLRLRIVNDTTRLMPNHYLMWFEFRFGGAPAVESTKVAVHIPVD